MQTPISSLSLHPRSERNDDSVAQPVEHNTFNVGVLGSNPSWITKKKPKGVNKKTSPAKLIFCGTFLLPFGNLDRHEKVTVQSKNRGWIDSGHYKINFCLHNLFYSAEKVAYQAYFFHGLFTCVSNSSAVLFITELYAPLPPHKERPII